MKTYLTDFYKWNTTIKAKSPAKFILKVLGYCLLIEIIYKALMYWDFLIATHYQIKNVVYQEALFCFRVFVWLYLYFCTFNKLRNTLDKKFNYVIIPITVLMFLKWFFPYICYYVYGFNLLVLVKTCLPFVLLVFCVFYIWFTTRKSMKAKFK